MFVFDQLGLPHIAPVGAASPLTPPPLAGEGGRGVGSLRIALLTYRGAMGSGGQGVYVHYLSRALAAAGHAVHVVAGPPYPDVAPGVHLHRLPNARFYEQNLRLAPQARPHLLHSSPLTLYEYAVTRIGAFPEPFAFSLRAFRWLARRQDLRFDVIHDNQGLGYGLTLLPLLGLPLVATVHHASPLDRQAELRRARTLHDWVTVQLFYPILMQKLTLRAMRRVICVSAPAAREIRRWYRLPPAKLRLVPNGVDGDTFRPLPAEAKTPGGIIAVGRATDRHKGLDVLVEAAGLVARQRSLRLTVVDWPQGAEVARLWLAAAGLDGQAEWVGPLSTEELVRRYNRAELAVVPSRYEGFSLPAVEAMACGLPVVATAVGGLSSVVRHGETGLLVPPEDPRALARAIQSLLDDEPRRRALGAAARAWACQQFSWARAAAATAAVYGEVMRHEA